jgi:heme exporter protein A
MLLANNINFKRNNKSILNDINIALSPKKIIHLTGENGVGKTTLLKILASILEPEKGDLFWNGKNIKKNIFEYYKNLTFIMDQPSANNILTVSDNIFFWCKLFYSRITLKEIDSILKLLSLNDYKNTPVSNLSYGEIKKLELCRLIIERKKLWILDEPFIGLDNKTLEIFNETIKNHAELGGMVIFTSHIKSNVTNIEKMELENDKII